MRLIGAWAVAVILLTSCKSVKRSSFMADKKTETTEAILTNSSRKIEEFIYGDTLRGRMPLPVLSRIPVIIPIESKGISLELSIDDQEITYKAVAKPVARSTLYEDNREEITTKTETAEVVKETRKVKRLFIPWWIILIAVIVIAVGVLRKATKIKIPF
jgi:hypothetical protein